MGALTSSEETIYETHQQRAAKLATAARVAKQAGRREEQQRILCEILRLGSTRTAATRQVGITAETFYEWLRRYPEFRTAVEDAEGDVETRFASIVADCAAQGDGRLALEWLKRRRRDDWGDSVDVRHLMAQSQSLSDDQLARKLYGEGAVIDVEGHSEDLPALGEGEGDE